MKRVVVRVSDNYSLDSAAAAILKLYGYLTFVKSYRSFGIVSFDCPETYQSVILDQLRALNVVKRASWDEEKYSCDPVEEGATLNVGSDGDISLNSSGETNVSANTRNLTGSVTGTIYVKVQSFSGNNLYVFSNSPGGTYSLYTNQAGFIQGGTYTFDQSDSSNTGHPFKFSETPDGPNTTGGTEYTTGVTLSGTPGTNGTTEIVIGSTTPSIPVSYTHLTLPTILLV